MDFEAINFPKDKTVVFRFLDGPQDGEELRSDVPTAPNSLNKAQSLFRLYHICLLLMFKGANRLRRFQWYKRASSLRLSRCSRSHVIRSGVPHLVA